MDTKKYTISKWFVVTNYFSIVGSFIIAAFFILGSFYLFHDAPLVFILVFILTGIGFIVGGIYSINILPQMKDIVYISESQIMREHFADGTTTTILWKENFTVRNRHFLGRLELISQDGQRIVKIEHQIDEFQEIYALITTKIMEKQSELK